MKRILMILVSLSAIVLAGMVALFYVLPPRHSFPLLTTKGGYVFEINLPESWEGGVPLTCTITKDGDVLFSEITIGYARSLALEEYRFALIESGKEGELVAIIEQANPLIVLAIFDLKRDKWWGENRTVRQELLDRLKLHTGRQFFWPSWSKAKEPKIAH